MYSKLWKTPVLILVVVEDSLGDYYFNFKNDLLWQS